jgi:hypothetical protein
MAEGQHLSSELGVGARANQAQLGEKAGKRLGEAEEHGAASCSVGRTVCGRGRHWCWPGLRRVGSAMLRSN